MIRIFSRDVASRTVKTEKGEFTFRTQDAALVLQGKYGQTVSEFKLGLDGDQPAHEPGDYELAASSFVIDKNARLSVSNNIQLLPVAAVARKPA